MKRDPELIRLLLLRTESGGEYVAECEKYDIPTRAFHVWLMKEDGLVEAIVSKDAMGQPAKAVIQRMTTNGYEHLDKVRNSGPAKDGPATLSALT